MLPFRTEGPDKVTGRKVFATDFRPRDLPGWPEQCLHAVLLRATTLGRSFEGISLASIPTEFRPTSLFVTTDLVDGLALAVDGDSKSKERLFVSKGELPQFGGQPVGFAVFADYEQYFSGANELRESTQAFQWGPIQPLEQETTAKGDLAAWRAMARSTLNYSEYHLVRDLADDGTVEFSRVKDGASDPFNSDPNDAKAALNTDARARFLRTRKMTSEGSPEVRVLSHTASTQMTDPMFLEPEAGLGWLDGSGVLHLVLGTQSPGKDESAIRNIFRQAVKKPVDVNIISCDCGGGFGGRDVSLFAQYLALIAFHASGPVRLVYDRYEQFQAGIKRHGSASHIAMSFHASGTFNAIEGHVIFEGGGQANLTAPVNQLGTLHLSGPYKFKNSSLHGCATKKRLPIVGSMRGFGIPQVCFNVEVLVDRVASQLGADPIELRERNLLRIGDTDAAGTPLRFHLANERICSLAREQDLWRERDVLRSQRSNELTRYGVGFAMCMEAYGTSADGVYGAVCIDQEGRIGVWSETIEMGQGARTAVQGSVESLLGSPAHHVHLGEYELFRFLKLRSDLPEADPRFSPSGGSTSSASKTAFFHLHALEQAAHVIWTCALAPAIRSVWNVTLTDDQLMSCWHNGLLIRDGYPPLSLRDLATFAAANQLPMGAMTHAHFYNGWTGASFVVGTQTLGLFSDALAIQSATDGAWSLIDRDPGTVIRSTAKGMPRTLYASGGHIVGVEVSLRSGEVSVVDAISIIDAGEPVHPELLHGQIEGGLAMGISYALHELLPPDPGRPRATNLDKYRIAMHSSLPRADRHRQILVPLNVESIVGPSQPRMRRKGAGEVTMTTVAPAIANAIAHAFDRQFWPNELPMRKAQILRRISGQ